MKRSGLLLGLLLAAPMALANWGVSDEMSRLAAHADKTLSDKERLLKVEHQVEYLLGQNVSDKLAALEDQLRELRGMIEANQYALKSQQDQYKKFYQDIDTRIASLQRASQQHESVNKLGKVKQGQDETAAYKHAFELLQTHKHTEAIAAFKAFLNHFPKGQYESNAWYWLGSAYLLDHDLASALTAFEKVVHSEKGNVKVPAAWYKMAGIYKERGDYAKARKAYQTIVDEFPGDQHEALARKALFALPD